MKSKNFTRIQEFFLSDISEIQKNNTKSKHCIYVSTILANLFIIFVVRSSSNLQTPMYFFLANFSFLEICYITSTVPKMLSNILVTRTTFSFYGCAMQMCWFLLLGATECYMLAAMAFDRYNAICRPLLYSVILNKKLCIKLILGCWFFGAANAVIHTVLTLPFCSNKTDHFICDVPPLLKLSCFNNWLNEVVIFMISGLVTIGFLILTLISYVKIISTIVSMKSNTNRQKAFSTCASHFTVVTIFFVSGIFMYFRPKSSYSMGQDRLIAMLYTVIVPLLNPFIYTFRNESVKIAVKTMIHQRVIAQKY
ncbi:Olfactory receptor [Pristimantis euphronides]